ncbi:zinc finger BED domain-containing protein RICESLEEPER 2-like [Humulus lupulus]|uniref:zinc finger BED domain-containing protein RICESLEEPER 2-like n=1 Tax=Humulus lupulus TaxID=3486 RepID=UPI002B40214F|nr:zinc finger BED domain-containing protein RICESLEEPER 2-like [Humulus lupulus]
MSTQDVTKSNFVDDVDYVHSTHTQEAQSLGNTRGENESRSTRIKITSPTLDHFTLQKIDGEMKAVCNHCGRKLVGESSNGTKHLLDHVKRCQVIKEQLATNPNSNESPSITAYNFDPELGRKLLAQMIILHEYPLSMIEHRGFIDYSNTICPMFKMVSWNTIRSDILKIYKIEKEKCSQILEKNRSRIVITTDMWTANHQKRGYITMTAHFIDDSWKLHNKISTVTVDNCTTNDAMIPLLKEKFNSSCFILKGKLLHMHCCAHILNLIVNDDLSVIGDSTDKIRDSVAYWSGTPKRCEKFEDIARSLEVSCTKKLSLDCQIRWNSTYLMLNITLLYNRVFEQLKLRDSRYVRYAPSEDDWIRAQKLCDRLEVFHEVIELFCRTKYPTSNLFFPKMFQIKMRIKAWIIADEPFIRDMETQMISKFQKYWEEIHGLMIVAVVLDPRYKFMLIEYYFPTIYRNDQYEMQIKKVHKLYYDLLEEYSSKFPNPKERSQQMDSVSASSPTQMDDLSNFDTYVRVAYGVENVKSELEFYLEEKLIPRTDELFDISNY